MALPLSETFDYVLKVPKEKGPDSFPWQLELGEEIEPSGDALRDDRVVDVGQRWGSHGGPVRAERRGSGEPVYAERP